MHDTTAAKIWGHPNQLACPLMLLLQDRYGLEALKYHPSTIRSLIKSDCGVDLKDGNLDRLMAALTIHDFPDLFYKKVPDFELLCRMLASDDEHARPKFGELASVHDCAWGGIEASLVCPHDEGWSNEVTSYVAVALQHDGFVDVPPVFKVLGFSVDKIDNVFDAEDDEFVRDMYNLGRKITAEELDGWVKERLQLLAEQLESLPLRNGSVRKTVDKLKKVIG